jgi:hypothetical protein
VRIAASDYVNIATPVLENANRKRRRTPKAVETYAFPALNSGNAEAAEADNARAQQGCNVGIVQPRRQWDREVGANRRIICVAAVHRITCKCGTVAEILHVVTAEPAIAVYPTHPGDADACSNGQIRRCAIHYFADDLMPGDNARPDWRQVALDDVEIGAADATGHDFEQYLSGFRLWLRQIFD